VKRYVALAVPIVRRALGERGEAYGDAPAASGVRPQDKEVSGHADTASDRRTA